jgi:transposase
MTNLVAQTINCGDADRAAKEARCNYIAAEVVAWPGGSALANMPPCLIGMEAGVGAHHLSRKLKELGHSPVPSAALFGANDSTPNPREKNG